MGQIQDPAANSGTTADGEILVTAQRRQERAREVPLTVTQVSGAQLENRGITDSAAISRITPGLRIDRTGNYTQPAIRGVSSSLTAAGTESPVAIYVDGIYQFSLTGLTFELPDVKNIEVLKGPQGTLFGRNATGGAIQVFTLDPQYTFGGKMLASYGNYNDVALSAFVTGPLANNVAISLSGAVHNNDGYYHDIITGKPIAGLKSHLVRGKLLVQPTKDLNITLTGFYALRNSGATVGQPLNGNSIDRTQPGAVIPQNPYEFVGTDPITDLKNYGGSLRAVLDTGVGTFSALTGYVKWDVLASASFDRGFVPGQRGYIATPHQHDRELSQELNFASRNFGRLSFVAGLFYFDGYGQLDPQATRSDLPTFPANIDVYSKQTIKAGAVYGEMNYALTDRFTVIAGVRYSDEKRRLLGVAVPGGASPGPLPVVGRRHDTGVTPRVSLKYAVSDQSNLYFTFSKGFKSGAFNASSVAQPVQSVAPEKITAYELGSKSRIGTLDLNVAAFYYDYTNLQVSAAAISNGQSAQRFQNAATARIYGLDVSAGVKLAERLRLSMGLALTNAKYEDFPAATITIPRSNNAGNITTSADVSGNYLNRAPKVTVNLTAEYTTDLAGGDLDLSSSLYYSSRYFFEASNRIAQREYALLDARIAWTPPDSMLTFAVYGRNLTNKAVFAAAFPSTFSDSITYAAPRTYGVSIGYKF